MHIDEFNKKQTLRDKPLVFDWLPENKEDFLGRLHKYFDFPIRGIKLRNDALCGIVINGIRNSKQGHWTSYSRNSNWYTGKKELYDCPHFTRMGVLGAFDDTKHSGMFDQVIASRGTYYDWKDGYKRQSAYLATTELIEAMEHEPRIYKHRKPVIVKDSDSNLVCIEDDDYSLQRRKDMAELNEFYMGSLAVSFDESYRQYGNTYKIGDEWKEVRPLQVHCSFNDSSWDKGGRLYHYLINLRKETRKEILINGEKTCEIDFSLLHPTMLFAEMGLQLDRDIYELGEHYGLGSLSRKLHKGAFAAVLNGTMAHTSADAMMKKCPPEWGITRVQAIETVNRIIAATPEIESLFFKQKGLSLMRKDSDLIVSVLKDLIRNGVPAISVHDSVIAPVQHSDLVRDTMLDAFSRQFPSFTVGLK